MNAHLSLGERLRLYRKFIHSLGVRGSLDRSYANHFGNSYVRTPWSKNPLFVRRGTSDMWTFDQIFVDHEYRCIDGLQNVRTIIDAGANAGYSSAYLLSRFPNASIIALEPDPGNFKALKRNASPWADRITCLQAALWSNPAKLSFREDTTEPGGEWGRRVEAEQGDVEAVDIPYLIEKYSLFEIDLLKVDIEGAEKHVFAADVTWLNRVRNIVIELHGDEEARIFHSAIKNRGYTISQCEELTVCLSN